VSESETKDTINEIIAKKYEKGGEGEFWKSFPPPILNIQGSIRLAHTGKSQETPAGLPPDWMTGEASETLTHIHLRHIKV